MTTRYQTSISLYHASVLGGPIGLLEGEAIHTHSIQFVSSCPFKLLVA